MATRDLDHLDELIGAQAQFMATIGEVDPATPVPWCGSWQARDLVVHLADVHHWAAAKASGVEEEPLASGSSGLGDLYRRCADELQRTLRELGPDAIGMTLLGPGPASFWRRRQLHETVVHLWDLRTAGGLRLDVDPGVWADTVDEVVTVMQPRQVRLGRMPRLPSSIGLVASDADRHWLLDSIDSADGGATVVQVRAPASVLALILWGRRSPDDVEVEISGDRAVLDAALAQPLTP